MSTEKIATYGQAFGEVATAVKGFESRSFAERAHLNASFSLAVVLQHY
jgi:hypothetical protein